MNTPLFFCLLSAPAQGHYSTVVAPAVSSSVAELSAAGAALMDLIRAAEGSITAVLRKSLDTFMTQVRRVLGSLNALEVLRSKGDPVCTYRAQLLTEYWLST